METKTRIETYSHAETLLEKLFQAPCESFVTELKKAADNYFQAANENDPKEEKEIRRNIEAIINQGMITMTCCICQYINIKTDLKLEIYFIEKCLIRFTDNSVFAEVVNAEQNVIVDLEKKSKLKPLLIFHDESSVINACDVISEMALNGNVILYIKN